MKKTLLFNLALSAALGLFVVSVLDIGTVIQVDRFGMFIADAAPALLAVAAAGALLFVAVPRIIAHHWADGIGGRRAVTKHLLRDVVMAVKSAMLPAPRRMSESGPVWA